MLTSLSGFEGCGKTTLVDELKTQHNYMIVPETARLLIPLKEGVFKDSKDDLSYHSFSAYLNSLNFILQNANFFEKNDFNVVFDRNMIDSLVFLQMYSTEQKIELDAFQEFIDKYNFENNREALFDKTCLIKHSNNNEHIEKNILNDGVRLYSNGGVEGYKRDAEIWEGRWFETFHSLKNFSKELVIVQAYPDNPFPVNDVLSDKKQNLLDNVKKVSFKR